MPDLALGSIGVPLALLARRTREGKILALALFLMVVGYSTHAYLPIRAAQHPAINEGDPGARCRSAACGRGLAHDAVTTFECPQEADAFLSLTSQDEGNDHR